MGTLAGGIALGVCLLVVVRMLWSLLAALLKGIAVCTFGAIVLSAAYRSGFLSDGAEGCRSFINYYVLPLAGARTGELLPENAFDKGHWGETVANLARVGLKKDPES